MELRCQGLHLEVGGRTLCRDLDLALESGHCWGLLGPNGCGKTLLLHTLAGLRRPTAGRVLLAGESLGDLSRRRIARRLGLLFQDPLAALPATVLETVLSGRHPHLRPWQWEQAEDYARARTALADVGLRGFEERDAASLSGGERQRVAIATLLTQAPSVYLLDEPANHLDLAHQHQILGHFRTLAEEGRTLLLSLHDPNLALRYCDHLILMGEGQTWLGPTASIGTAEGFSRLYGHPLHGIPGPGGPVMVPA